jgi:D-glycero-alpha-D-manno-heptose 1-phosphate guanylyltransferase
MAERLEDATAAILAGGLGTRLWPCLVDRPKVLAPVHGRPYLAYLLEQLADVGIRHTVLLTGHRAEQIHSTFGDAYAGLRLAYSDEPSPLGTAGALRRALPQLFSSTVLLLNGDSYCAVSLPDLWQLHHDRSADLSVVLTRMEDCGRYGRIALDSDDRLLGFEEKSEAGGEGWVNAGIYVLSRTLIQEIPLTVPASLERELCPEWVAHKRCFGFRCRAPFLDIGTPDSYAQADTFFAPV